MPLSFNCPACDHRLEVPDAAAGRAGACKFCHARIIAPVQAGQVARLADPTPITVTAVPNPHSASEPAESDHSDAQSAHPPFAPSAGPPPSSGYAAGDYLANPNVGKAFMSSGRPAIADFWKRFIAFGIDLFLMNVLLVLVNRIVYGEDDSTSAMALMSPKAAFSSAITLALIGFAIKVLYGTILEGSPLQATPGKAILGMKVCAEAGNRITFGCALWRNFCKWFTVGAVGFLPLVGWFPYFIFFYAMRDYYTQTLHDMFSGTVVAERNW